MGKKVYTNCLYGRCRKCKTIYKISCKFCGESSYFADTSKVGHVVCTNCQTYNKLVCSNSSCDEDFLVVKTPKDVYEKQKIDDYLLNLDDASLNSSSCEINDSILKMEFSLEKDKFRDNLKKSSVESITKLIIEDIKDVSSSSSIIRHDRALKENRTLGKGQDRILSIAKDKKDVREKKIAEKKIVNKFFDEEDSSRLDRKIYFGNIYDEEVFYDCYNCKKTKSQYVCPVCGKKDLFSLKYDALRCSCGYSTKVVVCDCEQKHSHSQLYFLKDDVKWRFSQNKSYYEYRKGRMLIFSTCVSCGIFKVEQCKSCGSTVNFGKPNNKNEVYCKNCGTVNQFKCDNPNCNTEVKVLKNPTSIEEKLKWLEIASQVKDLEKKLSSAPEVDKNDSKFSFLELDKDKVTESVLEDIQEKNKEIVSSSFINDVKEELEEKKQREREIKEQLYVYDNKKKKIFLYMIGLLFVLTILSYLYLFLS